MRTSFLLPVTALVAIAAGCGSDINEQASGSLPQRDLTLVTQTPEVEIASPVEMQQPRWAARPAPSWRSSPREPKVVLAAVSAPLAALGAPVAAAEPVAQPTTSTNDRELLPGTTVTLIPASSGPSAGPDRTDELPEVRGRTVVARGGGTCRGRGRGPGVGAAPRPDFRGRR